MLEETWNLHLQNGEQIWCGKKGVGPSVKELSQILKALDPNDPVADDNIANLASQIIKNTSSKIIPTLLSALSCNFWRHPDTGEIDIHRLSTLPSNNHNNVCGAVFKKGDLAWVCRTCGKDQTCVQCDKCYRLSDHEGHEVFFHRSSGNGGCCDWYVILTIFFNHIYSIVTNKFIDQCLLLLFLK